MLVVRDIWPVMTSLFLSGVVGIMVFPFFTYVPSSGWLNDLLPKVSFPRGRQHGVIIDCSFLHSVSCRHTALAARCFKPSYPVISLYL